MGRTLTAEKQLESALKSLLLTSGADQLQSKAAILVGFEVSATNKVNNKEFGGITLNVKVSDSRDHLAAIVPVSEGGEDESKKESEDVRISDHAQKVLLNILFSDVYCNS